MPPIVAVAIDAPLRRLFDYRPPAGSTDDALVPGTRLWVPFGRRRAVGVVIELRSRSDVPAAKLRTAIAKIGSEPIFDRPLLELLVWAADYYRHPIGEVIAAALPGPLRTGADAEATTIRWALSVAARTGGLAPLNTRALRLREMVSALEARRDAGETELAALSPRWREHLRELERRGWVTELRVEDPIRPAPPVQAARGPELSAPQQDAVAAIGRCRRPVPAVPAAWGHRQWQDRGLPACDRARGRAGFAGARPRPRDRPDPAARGAVHRALPGAARGAALLAHRPGAAARLARGAQRRGARRDRHALGGVRAARTTRPHRRRRGARRVIQAAGRLSLFGARPCIDPRAAAVDPGGARLGDAVAREPRAGPRRPRDAAHAAGTCGRCAATRACR